MLWVTAGIVIGYTTSQSGAKGDVRFGSKADILQGHELCPLYPR